MSIYHIHFSIAGNPRQVFVAFPRLFSSITNVMPYFSQMAWVLILFTLKELVAPKWLSGLNYTSKVHLLINYKSILINGRFALCPFILLIILFIVSNAIYNTAGVRLVILYKIISFIIQFKFDISIITWKEYASYFIWYCIQ